jgi:hypothetical protein
LAGDLAVSEAFAVFVYMAVELDEAIGNSVAY